jgi:hypothetical protein
MVRRFSKKSVAEQMAAITNIMAGRDAAPVLEAAEHDRDATSASIALVASDWLVARLPARDGGLDAVRYAFGYVASVR